MRRIVTIIAACLFAFCLLNRLHGAIDPELERRILVGGKIFTHLLSGDDRLQQEAKSTGTFQVWLIYKNQPDMAERASAILVRKPEKSTPGMTVTLLSVEELESRDIAAANNLSGIFLAQPLPPEDLKRIIRIANKRQVLLFSPFEGDVESGAATGFVVEVKVQPFLNLKALRSAGIKLRPLYLKVSKLYD